MLIQKDFLRFTSLHLLLFLFFYFSLFPLFVFLLLVSLFHFVSEVQRLNVFHHNSNQLIIYMGTCILRPNCVFGEPVPPELDCVLQTLKGTFPPEYNCIRYLQCVCQSRPYELLRPLNEGILVLRKTHCEGSKCIVELSPILAI